MRKIYVDFLRFIALFYMFFQHSVLALLAPGDNSGIILFLYELVPFCPALFLFLSGYSTTLKYEKDANFILDNKYLFRALKKGGILILSSMLLFFIEHGFQIPDFFVASGILNSIGWMIIISTLILKTKPKKTFFLLLIITLLALTVIFEKISFFVIPFNYGYEPTSPTIIYGFIGVFWGLLLISLKNEKTKNVFVILFGVSGVIILTFYAVKYGFGRVFHSDIGRYEVVRRFDLSFLPQSIFSSSKESGFYTAKIWNYNTECMIASFGAVA
ncbi:MAG TPA: heparan-alpha-glucosaminide N-acetyltransferase domain-containing protein, partial [Spirochaetota bacterium]|nr:heparan-alpha-glucosaminide N-acetyltransferase domain-containing protein [Spirochaetota bacterium]